MLTAAYGLNGILEQFSWWIGRSECVYGATFDNNCNSSGGLAFSAGDTVATRVYGQSMSIADPSWLADDHDRHYPELSSFSTDLDQVGNF